MKFNLTDIFFKYILSTALLLTIYSYLFASIYSPIRLYYTGYLKQLTVIKNEKDVRYGKDITVIYYQITSKELPYKISAFEKEAYNLKKGDSITAYISDNIKWGFLTNKKKISLLSCLFNELGYGILPIIGGWLLFIPILIYFATKPAKNAFKKRYLKIKEKDFKDDQVLKTLTYLREFAPYSIFLLVIYVLTVITIKGVVSVESSNLLYAGSFIFLSILMALYFPFIILTIKDFLTGNKRGGQVAALAIGVSLSLYAFIEALLFLITTDLTKFANLKDLFKALLEFMI